MSISNQSKAEYKSIPTSSTSMKGSIKSTAIEIDDKSSIFDQKKSWDDFKKEYYQIEKKIKKSLENLQSIQLEFTKHISLLETKGSSNFDKKSLFNDFQSISSQAKRDLDNTNNLFYSLQLNKNDGDELIKQNMLKRFKEIHQEHEREFAKLNTSIELNKKKLDLFNETLRLGELNVDKNKSSKSSIIASQTKDLERNISMGQAILAQGRMITTSFHAQYSKLDKINGKLKRLSEELGSMSEIFRKIKYVQLKKQIVFIVMILIFVLFVLYKILFSRNQ